MREREVKKGSMFKQLFIFIALLACTTTTTTTQKGCAPKNACDQDGDGYKVIGWVNTVDTSGKAVRTYCASVPVAQRDCNDLNINVWKSCTTCKDADGDGSFVGCDAYLTVKGPDCNDNDANNWESCATCKDADSDSYFTGCDAYKTIKGTDCKDDNAAVNPGAEEICDGVDNNCDDVLLEGETQDLNRNGILACMEDNDKQLEATVRIEPEAFKMNNGKFTAFVKLPEGFDSSLINSCVADGAVAIEIIYDQDGGQAVCKFNREDITVLPLDTLFEVTGTTSDGFTFYGSDTISKIIE
jgi:hypothetical protein